MRRLTPGLLVVAVAAGFSVWAYPHLPAEVATHFDLEGQPNGWSSRAFAAGFAPALAIAVALVFTAAPRIDPRAANYQKFGPTYWTMGNAALVLVATLQILMLGKALGWAVDMSRIAPLAIGGLLVLLGSLMTNIRSNWFIGIRTPWTLSSDTVWRKTHRFGGVAFIVAGLCVAATALLHADWAFYGGLGIVVAAVLSSVVYSYVVWKGEQDAGIRSNP